VASVERVRHPADVRDAVERISGERGVIARGLGRSYGAAAQNGGGGVVEYTADDDSVVDPFHVDHERGEITVAASVSLDTLLRRLVPLGWFVPVTPGTRYVTVGGAIAADIHGKNHHIDGSFGSHVRRLALLRSDGTVVQLTPDDPSGLFWATVGGMGLTGIILDATFGLVPIRSSRMRVETERCRDLDHLCDTMEQSDDAFRYSVAWIDLLAQGSSLGRSVLTRGDHAEASSKGDLGGYRANLLGGVPPFVPERLLGPITVRAFNEVWFRKAPARPTISLESIPSFFHPLDAVRSWNRLYGRRGFVQYQFVVPIDERAALRTVVERLASSGMPSFLAVLKRFGESNPAPLSFPMPGWTLALDLPARFTGVDAMLAELDEIVLCAGGRHYLAKDAHLTRRVFRAGYPRFAEWSAIRDDADPTGCWTSDLARRLDLVGASTTGSPVEGSPHG
jgi:decaprenylphospho-beta-D-ribofuranose 2-oxidase